MISIRLVIGKLKTIASGRTEDAPRIQPFDYSIEIDDSDEQDLDAITDVYPSKPDIPKQSTRSTERLLNWQNRCQVLISGVNIPIGMTYVDAKGDQTKREIKVQKLIHDEDLRYIQGFCHLRQAHRTFREDRAKEIIELETGEVHTTPATFFDKYGIFNTPRLEELQVMLHILVYLAKADRNFCEAEQGLISRLISDYCGQHEKGLIENYVYNHKVKKADFLNEVSKLAYMPETTVQKILGSAEAMIKIDGKVTPKEQELFDVLKG